MKEREIFILALQKRTPIERSAYLDQACAGNVLLRQSVEQLLHAEAGLGNFLEPPRSPSNGEIEGTIIAPISEGPGSRIGPYKLLQPIGEGGMGVVYMAEQTEPVVRRVALKIIKPGSDTRQVIARFEAERQALALMDHPCIAKVYDAGVTESGRPYFVMELVKGIPITKYCDQHQLPVAERLQLFKSVCQAVQHAHQKGIIHRDLKPSNILVALHDGEPVPMIIDFGLAKAIHQRLTEKTLFTEFGQVVGTPEYMSPEQAELNQLDIDTRTDIYSLGAVLYELLTGAPPFERGRLRSAAFDEMLRIIREEEPKKPSTRLSTLQQGELFTVSQQRGIDPRKLSSLFRGELDWVVMKALDKNRSRRYETANGLARDIERYLTDKPVEARPPSSAYRLRKYIRRHKVGTAAAAAGLLVLVAAIAGLAVSNRLISEEKERTESALGESRLHEQQAKDNATVAELQRKAAEQNAREAEEQRAIAQQERDEKTKQLYVAHMQIAHQEWKENHAARTRQLLDAYLPANFGHIDPRGWEWHYLWRLSHSERALVEIKHSVMSLALSPDGKTLIGGDDMGNVYCWNTENTREIHSWKAHSGRVQQLAIDGAGRVLATAGSEGVVKIWDMSTRKERRSFPGPATSRYGLTLSADGSRIAIASLLRDREIRVFDVAKGIEIRRLKAPALQISFSQDGGRLVSAGDRTVLLWEIETGNTLQNFPTNGLAQTAVAISPDGKLIVSGDVTGAVVFRDANQGSNLRWSRAHEDRINSIVFNGDGTRLATTSNDSTIRIWDVTRREVLHTFCGHDDNSTDVVFLPGTDRVVSSGWDATLRYWDDISRQEMDREWNHWTVDGVLYSPDGQYFAIADATTITAYEASTQQRLWNADTSFQTWDQETTTPWAYDRQSRWIAAGHSDQTGNKVRIYDATNGKIRQTFHVHSRPVTALQVFPDGRLVTGSADGEIAIWDGVDFRELARFHAHKGGVRSLAVSADGKWLASGGHHADPTIHVQDGKSINRVFTLKGHEGSVCALAFTLDGRQLFSGSRDSTIKCWDLSTGRCVRTEKAHSGSVLSLALSPDGRRLSSCSSDWTVKIWEVESGMEVLNLRSNKGPRRSLAFSADGLQLAAGGELGGVNIWDARPLTSELRDELAASRLLNSLFGELSFREDVLEAIRSNTNLTESTRRRAAELTLRYRIPAERYNNRSWAIVSKANQSADEYLLALRFAKAACDAVPDSGPYRNTLGVALFRVGRHADAAVTLTRSDELNSKTYQGSVPADLAFLAMANHELGQLETANNLLIRLRQLCEQDPWKRNAESQAFLCEAETLISTSSPTIRKPVEAIRPM